MGKMIQIKSGKRELRNFGLLMGAIFSVIAGIMVWQEKSYYALLLGPGFFFLGAGVFFPACLKPIYIPWMGLANILGWIMTRVILSLLFYLIVTPIGLIARVSGKQFLDLAMDKSNDSYWNYREITQKKAEEYERQF